MRGEPGTPYRPANSTESVTFQGDFCDICEHDRPYRENGDASCDILIKALVHYPSDHPDYPKEWVYDENWFPSCTAFETEEGG